MVNSLHKKCSTCGVDKPIECFSNDSSQKDGKRPRCKECYKKYRQENKARLSAAAKRYREDNKEKIQARHKRYKAENKEKVRAYWDKYKVEKKEYLDNYFSKYRAENKGKRLLRDYGISDQEYNYLLEKQKGVCYICGNAETVQTKFGKTKSLCVDHDHKTGVVRGLLCNRCNTVLGKVDDRLDLLKKMSLYLQRRLTKVVGKR